MTTRSFSRRLRAAGLLTAVAVFSGSVLAMAAWTPRDQKPITSIAASKTPMLSMSTPGMSSVLRSTAARPYNVAFARRLPYTVLVTEMGMNDMNAMVPGKTDAMMAMEKNSGLRTLFGGLVHTGSMPHGVNVVPGTHDALVSNFEDDPGTAVEVDMRRGRIMRRFTVGLNPTHFVVTPDRRYAFVSDFGSSDVYRLDLKTGATRRITLHVAIVQR